MQGSLHPTTSRRSGYSLVELVVALAVFAVGTSIVYPLLVGDLGLYARNFSINKSNNSLRYSLQMLKKDIDMSVEPPYLMSYRTSGSTGILKPLATTAVSSQAIMMWVNLGPAYDVVPTNGTGTGGTIAPSSGVTLLRRVARSTDVTPTTPGPVPQVGDRLMLMLPAPYSTGMPDTVTMDGTSISKPGRAITSVSVASTDTTSTSFKVQLDLTNPLPTGITGDKTAYIIREVAYVVNTVTDSNGNAVESDLLYYPTTANMTKPQILIRDLDPTPQEIDTTTGVVVQPFNYYNTRGTLSSLNVILPIRAVDYAHAVGDQHLGTATADTSSTEFNVYLRSNPQLAVKARLD